MLEVFVVTSMHFYEDDYEHIEDDFRLEGTFATLEAAENYARTAMAKEIVCLERTPADSSGYPRWNIVLPIDRRYVITKTPIKA